MLLLKVSVCKFANFETPKIRQKPLRMLDLQRLHVYGRPADRPDDSPSKTLDFAASIFRILEHGICVKTLKNVSFWSALRVLLGAASLCVRLLRPVVLVKLFLILDLISFSLSFFFLLLYANV